MINQKGGQNTKYKRYLRGSCIHADGEIQTMDHRNTSHKSAYFFGRCARFLDSVYGDSYRIT